LTKPFRINTKIGEVSSVPKPTLDDAVKLMEVGVEFHAEIEGHKLFRKRK